MHAKEIKALCTGTDIDRLAMIGVEVLLGSDDVSLKTNVRTVTVRMLTDI